MTLHWTPEDIEMAKRRNPDLADVNDGQAVPVVERGKQASTLQEDRPKKPNKYHAQATIYNGVRYPSKKEMARAQLNDLRVKAGQLRYWLRQIPFLLPGNRKHRVDFMEVEADGTVEFIEVKGRDLSAGRDRRREVEALYPVKIILV